LHPGPPRHIKGFQNGLETGPLLFEGSNEFWNCVTNGVLVSTCHWHADRIPLKRFTGMSRATNALKTTDPLLRRIGRRTCPTGSITPKSFSRPGKGMGKSPRSGLLAPPSRRISLLAPARVGFPWSRLPCISCWRLTCRLQKSAFSLKPAGRAELNPGGADLGRAKPMKDHTRPRIATCRLPPAATHPRTLPE
jgi:hypothetical protein